MTTTQRKLAEEFEAERKKTAKAEKKKHRFFASHLASKSSSSRKKSLPDEDPALGANVEQKSIELAKRLTAERAHEFGEVGAFPEKQQVKSSKNHTSVEGSNEYSEKVPKIAFLHSN